MTMYVMFYPTLLKCKHRPDMVIKVVFWHLDGIHTKIHQLGRSRARGSRSAGCAAAHPVFLLLPSKHTKSWPAHFGVITHAHTHHYYPPSVRPEIEMHCVSTYLI